MLFSEMNTATQSITAVDLKNKSGLPCIFFFCFFFFAFLNKDIICCGYFENHLDGAFLTYPNKMCFHTEIRKLLPPFSLEVLFIGSSEANFACWEKWKHSKVRQLYQKYFLLSTQSKIILSFPVNSDLHQNERERKKRICSKGVKSFILEPKGLGLPESNQEVTEIVSS